MDDSLDICEVCDEMDSDTPAKAERECELCGLQVCEYHNEGSMMDAICPRCASGLTDDELEEVLER